MEDRLEVLKFLLEQEGATAQKINIDFPETTYEKFKERIASLQKEFTLGDVYYILHWSGDKLQVWYSLKGLDIDINFLLEDVEYSLEKLSGGNCHIETETKRKLVCNL